MEIYLYDFRIIRYISLLLAGFVDTMYLIMVREELQLIYYKTRDDIIKIDVFFSLIFGYTLIMFLPTFLIDFFIILKEMTLNQLAWTKEEDY